MGRIKMTKPVILICAYNEEKDYRLETTLTMLRSQFGGKYNIIVVDDGSTDNTAQIANRFNEKDRFNVTVVTYTDKNGNRLLDENGKPLHFGKTNAFFLGIKKALELNPSCVITLDADMVRIPYNDLEFMKRIAMVATRESKIKMFVGAYSERGTETQYITTVSGIRAFSIPALQRLRASSLKKYPKNFALEVFLNKFFKRLNNDAFVELSTTRFQAREAYANSTYRQQFDDISKFEKRSKRAFERKKPKCKNYLC